MIATLLRLACGLVLLHLAAGMARAAEPDLRLVTAAVEQDMAAVRALVKQGADVNVARADGATALLWAAHWNDLETVELLLAARARVNAADDHGVTPLARAAENASDAMVTRLLRAKADPNVAQTSGLTPLMTAARTGSLRVVKQLLAAGANPNARTKQMNATALMWAVSERHGDVVRALAEAGADVHVSTDKGFTPLLYATRNGDIEMARVLLAAGVNVNEKGADGIHALPYSLILGHSDFAMFLLEQGADPNATIDGIGALHAAAGVVNTWLRDWSRRHGDNGQYSGGVVTTSRTLDSSQRLRLVQALIARGADVNARIAKSAMFMSYIGYPKKGAFEPFACGTGDLYGATPLWVAAYTANGYVGGFGGNADRRLEGRPIENTTDVIKALLAAGAKVDQTSDDGSTPLMMAAGLGRSTFQPGLQRAVRSVGAEEAVNVLLDAGADIHATNEGDFTAIHGAAFRGLNEVIEILVKRGANINARDYRGRTPYRLAEGSKQSFQFQAYPDTAEFIKKLGANTRLSIPGTEQERIRDVGVAIADANQP
jgi:ankyrin repeat protein